MEPDVEIVKEAIYWRGLFINRYSAVEFAIAELVTRCTTHPSYQRLGLPPFGPAKKLKRLNEILALPGPLETYKNLIENKLNEFVKYEDHRHFFVHAMMVPRSATEIVFQMYDHREGEYSIGELNLEMRHMQSLTDLLAGISIEFTELIASICKTVPLSSPF